jgi:HD-GYP domain-containing protein (c-di-GMP phosphodiesterase class II)/pSer/pThr/pTyr-binding forkhead associated (FHA) protein
MAPDASVAAPLQLVVRGSGRVIPLAPGATVTLGRVPQCDLQIDDESVSRRHCTIAMAAGPDGPRLTVTDLGSANGTFVNDTPVQSATAGPGDTIQLGATLLDVRVAAGEPPGAFDTVMADTGPLESVIRKKFEPAQLDWLTGATPVGLDVGLLERIARHLRTLHEVSGVLASARDIDGVSKATLGSILNVTGADRAAIVLRRGDPDADRAEVAAAQLRLPGSETFTVSQTLVADVIAKGVSTFAYDASTDERFASGHSVITQRVRSVMCVPLRTTDEILGALYVDSLSGAGRFSEADLELLAAIGNQAGVALHRVRLLGEIERLLIDTIRAIAATIDAKDGYTHRHSERVAMLSKHLAIALGMSPEEQDTVELSGLLHDVGKIAVPDSILNKPGRLSAEEFDQMMQHPVHGDRILGNIQSPSIKAVLPGVRFHHEKWDGTGYPDRLAGEEIPFLGRLLGVADVFDALTSARAYRGAMPAEFAVNIIREGSGTHFDPRLAELVIELHARGVLLPPGWEA